MGKLRASAGAVRRTTAAPVVTRNVLDDLAPQMRELALRMSRDTDGRPDPSRIVVMGRGSFEVMPVGWKPPRR